VIPETPAGVTVLAELGRGAQTVVYRVSRDGRDWAMKVFPDGTALPALRREASLLAWTNHPGLPRVHEVGEAGRRPYLIMELIEGRSLGDLLRVRPLAVDRVLRLGIELAGALAALHEVGLVHRDVKPYNIMIEPDGTARLIDLGMAGRATGAPADAAVGTLQYSAPEQGGTLDRPVDARSDLYAVGAVLYESLTGAPPFASTDVSELLRLHAGAAPPDPRDVRPEVPDTLAAVTAKLLAKDPDDRYQSGAGLVADLRRLAADPSTAFALDAAGSAAGSPDRVPLTGRRRELDRLAERWRQARAGQGGFAIITGGPGAGKSRLAQELGHLARGEGAQVFAGACPEAPAPLAPLRAALGERLGRLDTDDPEAFTRSIVARVEDLARAEDGVLLCLDDVHRADEATRAVLRLLAAGVTGVPLLVVLTVADDGDAALPPGVLRHADPTITLGPLDPGAAMTLIAALAHGRNIDDAVLGRLAAGGGSSPLEIQEYLAAVVDAGVLLPSWGQWRLDTDRLDRIALTGDLHALVLRRLDGLSEQCRALLTAAAVVGPTFSVALAAAVAGFDPGHAAGLFAEATTRGAVRRLDDGYGFAHEQLRLALLDGVDPARLRDLHQRVAELLDAAGGDGPAHTYTLARHHLQGHTDREPARVVEACRAAGALALAEHAPREAVVLLEPAYRLAMTGLPPAAASEIGELLGAAYHQSGQLARAVDTLTGALDNAVDRFARARILVSICAMHCEAWDLEPSLATMRQALSEIDIALPENPLRLLAGALGRFAAGLVIERTGLGFGTATETDAVRFRLQAQLYRYGGAAANLGLNPTLALALLLRSVYAVSRLGFSVEYVQVRRDVACLLYLIAGPRLSGGGFARATHAAAEIGDHAGGAFTVQQQKLIQYIAGRGSARHILADSADPDRQITTGTFLTALGGTLWVQLLAGFARDAQALYQEGVARVDAADLPESSLVLAGASVAAAMGRVAEADASLRSVADNLDAFRNPSRRISLLLARAQVAVEQRDLGEAFDRVAVDFAELRISPKLLLIPLRAIFVYLAYGRLEQCRTATPEQRTPALAAARQAVAVLRGAGTSALLKAHCRVAQAWLRHLDGDPAGALAALGAADPLLRSVDAPLASYEAARLRAHVLLALGQSAEATVAAAGALALAARYEWPHRAQWIRDEVGVDGLAATDTTTAVSRRTRVNDAELNGATYRMRLDAVAAMSLAAARIVDPAELTRVALDETIRLLSAERAYLFLTDERERLVPHLGRDAAGNDLTELVGYGSSLVERARQSREPLVVTGTDEGAALGSRSAVAHGLRSIMVSPLLHDGRLLGVLYLDSRVAKGMFTTADVGVLSVITMHVAAALETTRAAQLTADVRLAQHERDIAETLRTAMEHMSGTLVPAEVLDRLRSEIGRALRADHTLLAVCEGDKVLLTDRASEDGPAVVDSGPAFDRLLAGVAPVSAETPGQAPPAPFASTGQASWVAVPLRTRDEAVGAVFVSADRAGVYGQTHRELAAVLAGQGMVAYENARLFEKVAQLAVTDGLTGLFNRRHFFQLADREIAVARRRSSPLTAMMLDIDHFKQVNDRFGHPVGDQVIVAVAARLGATVRKTDLLGRYGGEEFVIFLPDTGHDGANILAERTRAALADRAIDTDAGPLTVTASIGLASYEATDTEPGTLLARADEALYGAKQNGRNCVVNYTHEAQP
jgi:diguanylate cyclase (GGDEF)-like protein